MTENASTILLPPAAGQSTLGKGGTAVTIGDESVMSAGNDGSFAQKLGQAREQRSSETDKEDASQAVKSTEGKRADARTAVDAESAETRSSPSEAVPPGASARAASETDDTNAVLEQAGNLSDSVAQAIEALPLGTDASDDLQADSVATRTSISAPAPTAPAAMDSEDTVDTQAPLAEPNRLSQGIKRGAGASVVTDQAVDTGRLVNQGRLIGERSSEAVTSLVPPSTATASTDTAANAGRTSALAQPPTAAQGEMLASSHLPGRQRHVASNSQSLREAIGAGRTRSELVDASGQRRVNPADAEPVRLVGNMADKLEQGSDESLQRSLTQTDVFQHLQRQRAALTDAVTLQGNSLSADSLSRSQAADNLLPTIPSSIVTSQLIPRGEGVATPLATAPGTVSLTATDSEIALAGNVRWMAKEGIQSATVNVRPAGMGPISVHVGIEQDQMSISIVASQQATREALDAMLPRLREQLLAQGHESVRLDVNDGRGDMSRNGQGQMFAGTHDSAASWSQGEKNGGDEDSDQTKHGQHKATGDESDTFLAEDLQRVAQRRLGSGGQPLIYDAYV